MPDSIMIVFLGVNASQDESLIVRRYKHGLLKVQLRSNNSKSWETVMRLEDLSAHLDVVAHLVNKDAFGSDQIRDVQIFVPGVPTVLIKTYNFSQNEKTQEAVWNAIEAWHGQDWACVTRV